MNLVRRDAEPEIFWGSIAIQAIIVGVLLFIIAYGAG